MRKQAKPALIALVMGIVVYSGWWYICICFLSTGV